MPSSVLIDSSIWVDYLSGKDASLCARVDEHLHADEAAISGLILGEVLYGAKSESEFALLADTFSGIRCLVDDVDLFIKAADLGRKLRAKGLRVPLSDLSIAAHCIREGLGLLTRDRHFELIEEGIGKKFTIPRL